MRAPARQPGPDEPSARARLGRRGRARCRRLAVEADERSFKAHYRLAQALVKAHEGDAARRREAIDAAERALELLDERTPPPTRSKSAAADAAAARNAIEELLVQLLSGVPRAAGAAAPRIDKAASIMQQILRRKGGGDDGAHEMLAMNGEGDTSRRARA